MRIRFTPSARTQFLAGVSFIRKDNPKAAVDFRTKTEKDIGRLREFSRSGRVIPEFPYLPHRELLVKPYSFFYREVARQSGLLQSGIVLSCYIDHMELTTVDADIISDC